MIEAGMDVDAKKAYRVLMQVIKKYGSNYPRHFNMMLKALGKKEDAKIIAAGIVAYHNTKASIMPYPEVPRTLVNLRDKGYILCIASEGNAIKQWDKIIRLGLSHIFHRFFVSDEIGAEKSLEFYRRIAMELGLEPGQIAVVGDKIDRDVRPAEAIGMKAILFDPEKKFRYKRRICNIKELQGIFVGREVYGGCRKV
ncbi:MAG: HAD hydrolase-like protein, partial [Candidatus Micrarchaeia archaeon]